MIAPEADIGLLVSFAPCARCWKERLRVPVAAFIFHLIIDLGKIMESGTWLSRCTVAAFNFHLIIDLGKIMESESVRHLRWSARFFSANESLTAVFIHQLGAHLYGVNRTLKRCFRQKDLCAKI
ncbi:hypothetical protein scyTo_0007467 [Scyliorhinus torazame]|uniref:Uncharacterized protein n=1 Tax=Scyliorhinus torazame TaxID=75743 RepID=A0A401NT14_SCYTO|nr:hypothetical protein [Scyliorhinus torazame]